MDDRLILDTTAALDRALARIAVSVAGCEAEARELLLDVGQGRTHSQTAAFLREAAAILRARQLLAAAAPKRVSLRKRVAA